MIAAPLVDNDNGLYNNTLAFCSAAKREADSGEKISSKSKKFPGWPLQALPPCDKIRVLLVNGQPNAGKKCGRKA